MTSEKPRPRDRKVADGDALRRQLEQTAHRCWNHLNPRLGLIEDGRGDVQQYAEMVVAAEAKMPEAELPAVVGTYGLACAIAVLMAAGQTNRGDVYVYEVAPSGAPKFYAASVRDRVNRCVWVYHPIHRAVVTLQMIWAAFPRVMTMDAPRWRPFNKKQDS